MVDRSATHRDRRTDILQAAETEFAAAGWAGARVERVAAAARVNKQLLFHYFDSKEGLFAAALRSMLAPATSPSPLAESPAEELRQLLGRLLQTVRERPGLVAILTTASSDPGFPANARVQVVDFLALMVGRVRATVEDGQRRGYFRDDIDPAEIAALGVAAVLGAAALDHDTMAAHIGRLVTDVCTWR